MFVCLCTGHNSQCFFSLCSYRHADCVTTNKAQLGLWIYYVDRRKQHWATYIRTLRIFFVISRIMSIIHSSLFTLFQDAFGFINRSCPSVLFPPLFFLCFSSVAVKMTTARYRPTWELAVDPLVSCKLCLGEFPLEQMTTITQCQCVFCTLVSRMLYNQHIFCSCQQDVLWN